MPSPSFCPILCCPPPAPNLSPQPGALTGVARRISRRSARCPRQTHRAPSLPGREWRCGGAPAEGKVPFGTILPSPAPQRGWGEGRGEVSKDPLPPPIYGEELCCFYFVKQRDLGQIIFSFGLLCFVSFFFSFFSLKAKRNAWKATSPALEWALHRAPITGIKKLNSCTGIPAAGRILGESTANPAGCQRFSRPSPRIPFNPGSIPLGKSTRRAAVPSPGRHRGLQAAQTRSEGCALHVPAGGSGTEVPAPVVIYVCGWML